jgi:hypothetical protein
MKLNYDKNEMNGYKWLTYEETEQLPIIITDPHMHRFINIFRQFEFIN